MRGQGCGNFLLTDTDFPGLSGLGFLYGHVQIYFLAHAKTLLWDFSARFRFFKVPQVLWYSCKLKDQRGTQPYLADLTNSQSHFSFPYFFQMMSTQHLTRGWLQQQLLIALLKLCLTFAGPLRPLNGTECTAKGPASYILVFTGHWSPQAFPKQYPLFRPPAQWSKLIGESDCWDQRSWLFENQTFLVEQFYH